MLAMHSALYHNPQVIIELRSQQADAVARARAIAAQLDAVEMTDDPAATDDRHRLVITDERVELYPAQAVGSAVAVDFSSLRSISASRLRTQPLARAVGISPVRVVDATAGLGQDAFLLACIGHEVTAVERSPLIAVLLADGVARAEADAKLSRSMRGSLQVVHADARQHLLSMTEAPDVVYIDPMFPPKRRASALPRKEIQALRQVVGDDEDAEELLGIALRVAAKRVVVKRPGHAPPLEPAPTTSHTGKLARYDVYAM